MNKNTKCIFILPYFGKFNNYFKLFLKSCEFNQNYHWLIITDNTDNYKYPSNVRVISMSFKEIQHYIKSKFTFNLSLNTPYKLCDYKPAYGFIFEEFITDFEYWGHCDCDLIFGNLSKLLTPLLEKGYDKLFATGHLTIYKNNYSNNRIFMNIFNGLELYKKVLSSNQIEWFDEDFNGKNNIHSIFIEADKEIYSIDHSMNVFPDKSHLTRAIYIPESRKFILEPFEKSRYFWNDGNIICTELSQEGQINIKEYLYIHLQGRKMRMNSNLINSNIFEILPDRFTERNRIPANKKEMKLYSINFTYLFYLDYFIKRFKRKINNIKNHISEL